MNGLLAQLFSTIDSKKRQLGGLLSDPLETLYQGVRNFGTEQRGLLDTQAQAYPWTGMTPQAAPDMQARKALADAGAAQGMAAATVWHGSPHKFDKFDSSKIGTGEGAQAYGHGLYLAESPDVARTYSADRAYVGAAMQGKPKPINYDDPTWIAQKTIEELGDPSKATAHLKMVQRTAGKHQSKETKSAVQGAIDLIASGGVAPKGSLYKVDLPDEHIAKMLNLDAPIEQAPSAVQEYYKRVGAYKPGMPLTDHMAIDSRMAEEFSKKGIPGIRYLDGGSRGAGTGTSNYVVFPGNEGLLSILERNGQALK